MCSLCTTRLITDTEINIIAGYIHRVKVLFSKKALKDARMTFFMFWKEIVQKVSYKYDWGKNYEYITIVYSHCFLNFKKIHDYLDYSLLLIMWKSIYYIELLIYLSDLRHELMIYQKNIVWSSCFCYYYNDKSNWKTRFALYFWFDKFIKKYRSYIDL